MNFGRDDYNAAILTDLGQFPDPEEPALLIRGQDRLSGPIVRFAADLLEQQGGDAETVASLRAHAVRFAAWPKKTTLSSIIPDPEEPAPAEPAEPNDEPPVSDPPADEPAQPAPATTP